MDQNEFENGLFEGGVAVPKGERLQTKTENLNSELRINVPNETVQLSPAAIKSLNLEKVLQDENSDVKAFALIQKWDFDKRCVNGDGYETNIPAGTTCLCVTKTTSNSKLNKITEKGSFSQRKIAGVFTNAERFTLTMECSSHTEWRSIGGVTLIPLKEIGNRQIFVPRPRKQASTGTPVAGGEGNDE